MAARLRVGVIGLGGRWPRYRAALGALGGRLEVRAVCDQSAARAGREAERLGCSAAAGAEDLLGRPDVDAVLLPGGQWFGLWPLSRACEAGKPVLCAAGLAGEPHADALRQRVRSAGLPVLMALTPVSAPAAGLLRRLLADQLGPPRLVRGEWSLASRHDTTPPAERVLRSSAALSLLAGCAALLNAEPERVWAGAAGPAGLVTVLLEFAGGRAAQLSLWAGPGVRPGCRLEAVAEKGSGAALLPGRLRWRDDGGRYAQEVRSPSAEQSLLAEFVRSLRAGRPPWPGFEEAYRALTWQRAALRSHAEGRPVAPDPVG